MDLNKQFELSNDILSYLTQHEGPDKPKWFQELFTFVTAKRNELDRQIAELKTPSIHKIDIAYRDKETKEIYEAVPIQDWVNKDIVKGNIKLHLPSRLNIVINRPFPKMIKSPHFSVKGWTRKLLHKKIGTIFTKHADLLGGLDALDGILLTGFQYNSETHELTVELD